MRSGLARARLRAAMIAGAAFLAMTPAMATETITYTYDARGRLVKTEHSGTANNGVSSCYAYDAADNRTGSSVATTSACVAGGGGGGTPPSFSIGDDARAEGTTLQFTVTRSGSSTGSYSLSYATANNTAIAGSDYTAKSGTLDFLDGQTSKVITVATTDDTTVESSETLYVNLSNPTNGATITDAQAVGTITDNDTAGTCSGVSFSVGDKGVLEGENMTFTVTKSGSTSSSCSVSYATANNTAVAEEDYGSASASLSFASTETQKTVTITTVYDLLIEGDETFYLNLSNATGGSTISDPQALGTILDNSDPNPCPLC